MLMADAILIIDDVIENAELYLFLDLLAPKSLSSAFAPHPEHPLNHESRIIC